MAADYYKKTTPEEQEKLLFQKNMNTIFKGSVIIAEAFKGDSENKKHEFKFSKFKNDFLSLKQYINTIAIGINNEVARVQKEIIDNQAVNNSVLSQEEENAEELEGEKLIINEDDDDNETKYDNSFYNLEIDEIDKNLYLLQTKFNKLNESLSEINIENNYLTPIEADNIMSGLKYIVYYKNSINNLFNVPDVEFSTVDSSDKFIKWFAEEINKTFQNDIYYQAKRIINLSADDDLVSSFDLNLKAGGYYSLLFNENPEEISKLFSSNKLYFNYKDSKIYDVVANLYYKLQNDLLSQDLNVENRSNDFVKKIASFDNTVDYDSSHLKDACNQILKELQVPLSTQHQLSLTSRLFSNLTEKEKEVAIQAKEGIQVFNSRANDFFQKVKAVSSFDLFSSNLNKYLFLSDEQDFYSLFSNLGTELKDNLILLSMPINLLDKDSELYKSIVQERANSTTVITTLFSKINYLKNIPQDQLEKELDEHIINSLMENNYKDVQVVNAINKHKLSFVYKQILNKTPQMLDILSDFTIKNKTDESFFDVIDSIDTISEKEWINKQINNTDILTLAQEINIDTVGIIKSILHNNQSDLYKQKEEYLNAINNFYNAYKAISEKNIPASKINKIITHSKYKEGELYKASDFYNAAASDFNTMLINLITNQVVAKLDKPSDETVKEIKKNVALKLIDGKYKVYKEEASAKFYDISSEEEKSGLLISSSDFYKSIDDVIVPKFMLDIINTQVKKFDQSGHLVDVSKPFEKIKEQIVIEKDNDIQNLTNDSIMFRSEYSNNKEMQYLNKYKAKFYLNMQTENDKLLLNEAEKTINFIINNTRKNIYNEFDSAISKIQESLVKETLVTEENIKELKEKFKTFAFNSVNPMKEDVLNTALNIMDTVVQIKEENSQMPNILDNIVNKYLINIISCSNNPYWEMGIEMPKDEEFSQVDSFSINHFNKQIDMLEKENPFMKGKYETLKTEMANYNNANENIENHIYSLIKTYYDIKNFDINNLTIDINKQKDQCDDILKIAKAIENNQEYDKERLLNIQKTIAEANPISVPTIEKITNDLNNNKELDVKDVCALCLCSTNNRRDYFDLVEKYHNDNKELKVDEFAQLLNSQFNKFEEKDIKAEIKNNLKRINDYSEKLNNINVYYNQFTDEKIKELIAFTEVFESNKKVKFETKSMISYNDYKKLEQNFLNAHYENLAQKTINRNFQLKEKDLPLENVKLYWNKISENIQLTKFKSLTINDPSIIEVAKLYNSSVGKIDVKTHEDVASIVNTYSRAKRAILLNITKAPYAELMPINTEEKKKYQKFSRIREF